MRFQHRLGKERHDGRCFCQTSYRLPTTIAAARSVPSVFFLNPLRLPQDFGKACLSCADYIDLFIRLGITPASTMMNLNFASLFSQLATIFLLCTLVEYCHAAPQGVQDLHNVTISLPENSRYNATQHLLCTPSSWKSIAPFFLANYFAHVATVRTIPGEPIIQVVAMMLTALLFPASGLARGLDAIFQSAKRGRSPLEVACKAGALCVVVRMPEWTPSVPADRRLNPPMPTGTPEGVTWIDEEHLQQPLSIWASRFINGDQGGPDNEQTSEGITWQDESYLRQPHRAWAARVIDGDQGEPGSGHNPDDILLNDITTERSPHNDMHQDIDLSDQIGGDELPQGTASTVELISGEASVNDNHIQGAESTVELMPERASTSVTHPLEIEPNLEDVLPMLSIGHGQAEEIAPVSKQPTLENIHEIMAQSGWDEQGQPIVAELRPSTAHLASMVYQFLPATNWYSWLGLSTHGVMDLPAGYALAILPYNFPMSRLEATTSATREATSRPWYKRGISRKSERPGRTSKNQPGLSPDIHADGLSSAWSPAKAVIALFQILYASFTLFETQGDQVDRFWVRCFRADGDTLSCHVRDQPDRKHHIPRVLLGLPRQRSSHD